ncbi:MAG TPA: glycosyltransferase [Candidatus Methylacidiphilales bacterium]|jgi:glycosyltransferase involved in cell wall biosynthesis|nr:glycosyltransferase [Candidatus Methylacidiphilales bacterium]
MRVLNLAPHCTIPPKDGADRRAWHLHESLLPLGIDECFVARNAVANGEELTPVAGMESSWRNGKMLVALAALLSGKSYWQFKMLTPAFVREVAGLRPEDYHATIIHFLYSLPLLEQWRGRSMRLLVETHNYDPAIYAGLRDGSRNPLLRYLCDQAARNSLRALAALPKGTTLVHVSEGDAAAYREKRPDLRHVVIENGCRVAPRASTPDYAAPGAKQLLFVGSLSAQMNQDALVNFSRTYWPSLRGVAKMRVVGSLPPSGVATLCIAEGWELCPNVSDDELEGFYASAHFAVAPFAYGAGSKLKLMEACGRGVPMLSTQAGVTGMNAVPPCVLVTDEPKEWKRLVQEWAPTPQGVRETLDFAEQVSWPALAARLKKILADSELVTIP